MLIAFNKPYGVVCRFTPDGSAYRTLSAFAFPKGVYPIGRLDADSEGLLLLSDEPGLNRRLLNPRSRHAKTYWAQVEKFPETASLRKLERGIVLDGRRTLPCKAWILDPQPAPSERQPPIRVRATIPTCWIGLELREGRNRQVRRMTAAAGHPTLRLIRVGIGMFSAANMRPGCWRILDSRQRQRVVNC